MTTTALRPRPSVAALLAGLGLTLVAVLVLSIFFGRYPVPYWIPPDLLFTDDMAQRLVLGLRLPRLIVSLALGMSLAAAGTVMQMIFRNPLVEPGFLGVTQGAAFGAALSILFLGSSLLVVQGVATFFALAGLALSYLLARYMRFGGWVLRLVLAGIAVSALFSSGVGVLKYLADPLTQLPEITFWLLGGLWSVTWRDPLLVAPVVLSSLTVLLLMRWRLNLLALNEETSHSLGVRPVFERAQAMALEIGAKRFAAENLAFLGESERLMGRPDRARPLLEEALGLCRDTGMSFIGPAVLGYLAAAAVDEPAVRGAALDEGDSLMAGGGIAHNHLLFGAAALETCLLSGDWARAEGYADFIDRAFAVEPMPFARFLAARGRVLARHRAAGAARDRGEKDRSEEDRDDLARIAREGRRLGCLGFLSDAEFAGA